MNLPALLLRSSAFLCAIGCAHENLGVLFQKITFEFPKEAGLAQFKVGVGVIGMGWMGHFHSRSYRHIADRFYEKEITPELVVRADSDRAKAEETRQMLRNMGIKHC